MFEIVWQRKKTDRADKGRERKRRKEIKGQEVEDTQTKRKRKADDYAEPNTVEKHWRNNGKVKHSNSKCDRQIEMF